VVRKKQTLFRAIKLIGGTDLRFVIPLPDTILHCETTVSTPGPVSTAMGDCLRAVNHLGAKPAS